MKLAREMAKWTAIAVLFAGLHFLAVIALGQWMHATNQTFESTPLVDLAFYLLLPFSIVISGDGPNGIWAVLLSSGFWGVALAMLVALRKRYLPQRFSLRTLLIAMTLLAVALGLGVWLAR